MTQVRPLEIAEIGHVLRAWSSEDDWGVPNVYTDTAMRLISLLARGANATVLAAHAKHMMTDCNKAECPPEWDERR